MSEIRRLVDQIAPVSIPVLLYGPTGTGKEILARYIHRASKRQGPFLKVSCAAIPAALLEAELFGFEKGAFTGAANSRIGLLERAECGTLLLDDVAALDSSLQAKLLHFLQDGSFTRLGSCEQRRVHARVISTYSHSLDEDIANGRFREDLFHRLSGTLIAVPALRDRIEDLPIIADYLLVHFANTFNTPVRRLSALHLRHLGRHYWPGNVRELENVLRRYVLLGTSTSLLEALKDCSPCPPPLFSLPLPNDYSLKSHTRHLVRRAETIVILKTLQQHSWNRTKSAESLNISVRALLYKMRSAGISEYAPYNRYREVSVRSTV